MLKTVCLSLLVLVQGAFGHGGHGNSGPAAGETIQQYAQRHVCFHTTFHTTKLIVASVIDVVRAPYVSIDAHFFPALLILLFNSDSFDIGSFFQLHDLDRSVHLLC